MKYDRIVEMREALGISQTDLAEKIGVSKQTLYKYENGIISNVPSDIVEAMANVFRITPAYLMGWTDAPHPETPTLSSLEEIVLSNFRLLDHSDQIEVGGIIKGMLLNDKYKKDTGDRTA